MWTAYNVVHQVFISIGKIAHTQIILHILLIPHFAAHSLSIPLVQIWKNSSLYIFDSICLFIPWLISHFFWSDDDCSIHM